MLGNFSLPWKMKERLVNMKLQAILPTLVFFSMITRLSCQSCGPRVSARLLAEIPCDMSQSSYCSVPGSAYPWQSVKRYIFDNQGLVRRMYGDERHNSVISKEMNEYRMRYNAHFLDSGTLLRFGRGRSIRGRTKPNRRQSRPQIFTDEPPKESLTTTLKSTTNLTPTEETIFRVVTETSVKIGEDTSPTLPSLTVTSTFTTFTQQDTETPLNVTMIPTITAEQNVEQDNTPTTVKQRLTTKEFPISSEENVTLDPNDSIVQTSTMDAPTPIAMKRVSFDDDYEYGEISKKKVSPSPQNSVEEKIKDKDYEELQRENDKLNDDGVEDLVMEETEGEDTKENGSDDNEDESVPRRGINACPVKNEVIAPYWANNTRGETLALLNVYPFEQYVHFEKCAFENHQMLCREGCRCEQQYRLHRLLAFDPRNECRGIFSDWFRFPSCCVCICYDLTPDLPRTRTRTARLK